MPESEIDRAEAQVRVATTHNTPIADLAVAGVRLARLTDAECLELARKTPYSAASLRARFPRP